MPTDATQQLKATYEGVKQAAEAHSNLILLGGVVHLLEAGGGYGKTMQRAAEKIIAICLAEQQRQLTTWDRLSGRDAWIAAKEAQDA